MNKEMQALSKKETWDLVPHSPHKKAIGCKWIYKVKYNADGSINCYKSRLIVKCYAQTYRVNYDETFTPMAKMTILQTYNSERVASPSNGCKEFLSAR